MNDHQVRQKESGIISHCFTHLIQRDANRICGLCPRTISVRYQQPLPGETNKLSLHVVSRNHVGPNNARSVSPFRAQLCCSVTTEKRRGSKCERIVALQNCLCGHVCSLEPRPSHPACGDLSRTPVSAAVVREAVTVSASGRAGRTRLVASLLGPHTSVT